MLKLIYYMIVAYLIVKTYKYFKAMFIGVKKNNEEPKVYQPNNVKRKIDDKDIVDAKFEEIDVKENPSSK